MKNTIYTTDGNPITFVEAFAKGLKPYHATITETVTKHVYIWAKDVTHAMEDMSDMDAGGIFIMDDNDQFDHDWQVEIGDCASTIYDTSDWYESYVSEDAVANASKNPDKDFKIWSAGFGKDDLEINDVQLNYTGVDIIASLDWHFDLNRKLGIPKYITRNENNLISMWAAYTPEKETVYMGVDIITRVEWTKYDNSVTIPIELSSHSEQVLREMFAEEIQKSCNMTPVEFVESERKRWEEE